jgi:chromosome segregation ATPase
MELVLLVGKKSKRINELKDEVESLEKKNDEMWHDLQTARSYIQVLKNDLKDLSTEFNRWRNGKAEKKKEN